MQHCLFTDSTSFSYEQPEIQAASFGQTSVDFFAELRELLVGRGVQINLRFFQFVCGALRINLTVNWLEALWFVGGALQINFKLFQLVCRALQINLKLCELVLGALWINLKLCGFSICLQLCELICGFSNLFSELCKLIWSSASWFQELCKTVWSCVDCKLKQCGFLQDSLPNASVNSNGVLCVSSQMFV